MSAMTLLTITSLTVAKRHRRNFDAVLTIEDPRTRPNDRLRFNKRLAPDHPVLWFEDLDEGPEHLTLPTLADAETILAFGRKHAQSTILCHCCRNRAQWRCGTGNPRRSA